jgi:hypothetical protein
MMRSCRELDVLRARSLVLLAIGMSIVSFVGHPAFAEACAAETESIRQVEPHGQSLPDCRAYEQVSPVAKNTSDAYGRPGFVQSSLTGESVSYYSIVPFPGISGSSEFPIYLSTRGGLDWSTQGLLPLLEADASAKVLGLTADNHEAVLSATEEEGPGLAPGATPHENNLYIHNNLTGEYRLIVAGPGGVALADSTPDGSHILIQAKREVLPGVADPQHTPYLYEWDRETGQLTFVGEAEGRIPEEGTVAGPNESEADQGENPYTQNAISENGSRIFFSESGEGQKVYIREPNADPPRTIAVSAGDAQWRAATPSGSFALYTEGGELYRFNLARDAPNPAAAREKIAGAGAKVLGTVGMSDDGSYIYFTAEGILASNENGNHEKAEERLNEANLYEWQAGAAVPLKFIAQLNRVEDKSDWEGFTEDEPGASDQGYKASRISSKGTTMLISSVAKLTSYDNAGESEAYLYDATEPLSITNPRCVSCSSAVSPARDPAYLSNNNIDASPEKAFSPFMTRNLSAEGTRVFFQTEESLVPDDTNGQMDVYEWEQEGTGSCSVDESDGSGGCRYLISSGQSTSSSYFGDASQNGEDVFFFTRQSLVSQDRDDNVDVYDAREDGGIASQNPPLAPPCESERCRGPYTAALALGVPSSVALTGVGDLALPPEEPRRSQPKAKTTRLARARERARALKACEKRPKRQRARCRVQAQIKYGKKAKKSARRAGR